MAFFVLALVLTAPIRAQTTDDASREDEVKRLVQLGQVETLVGRFGKTPKPDELGVIARAAANRAARTREPAARQKAFEDAEARFAAWFAAIPRDDRDSASRAVALAAARAELGGMYLSKWASSDLDEFELSAGLRGDRARLQKLLDKAREAYEQAAATLAPLVEQVRSGGQEAEDRLLSLGVYDAIRGLELDIEYNLAWTSLYIAPTDSGNAERRAAALRTAERRFLTLIDQAPVGETAYRVNLGLGMTLREQREFDKAERYFNLAQEQAPFPILAQCRYEQAMAHVKAGRFEQARVTLAPLLEKDAANLKPEELGGRFYVNLAHLWEANSYLVEADELRKQAARDNAGGKALTLRAQRARETGLIKMNRLAARGGSWPGVVEVFISASIGPGEDPKTLSPIELLFTARQLQADKKYDDALVRLTEAAGRKDLGKDLAGEVLYETGVCQYRAEQLRDAAATFARLAAEHKSHERAAPAATFAFQLWGRLAQESRAPADYSSLAAVLMNLLQSFPDHERRAEAVWWLPVALQSAERYSEAAEQFGRIPSSSARWEEAQFRRVVCLRLDFDARREKLAPAERTASMERALAELRRYAREALERAASAQQPAAVRNSAAWATVHAAELLLQPGVDHPQPAIDQLTGFEGRFPESDAYGRMLACRIRAYRGLRDFAAATKVVEEYLKSVPVEKAGPTLMLLARGMQEEVDRLLAAGDAAGAKRLATESVGIFEAAARWAAAVPNGAADATAIDFGLARMYHAAGRLEPAATLAGKLLAAEPRNGHFQRLAAQVATDTLSQRSSDEDVRAAQAAWSELLKDPTLRARAPERYWEARYHVLALLLRLGQAAEVEAAIRNERAFFPELGGPPWAARFNALYDEAARRAPRSPTEPGPAPP